MTTEAQATTTVGIGVVSALGTTSLALYESSAEPYTGKTDTELNKYIYAIWQDFVGFPNYEEQIHLDVYLLYKSFFDHYSLLFMTPGHIEGFLIHLVVNNKETEFRLDAVNLRSFSYKDKSQEFNTISLGTTEAFTAKCVIAMAQERLTKHGHYNLLFNNCQDYCKGVATEIQVSNVFKLWKDELIEILKGAATAGTAAKSTNCMQRVGPQTGSSLTKKVKELFEYYLATTKSNV